MYGYASKVKQRTHSVCLYAQFKRGVAQNLTSVSRVVRIRSLSQFTGGIHTTDRKMSSSSKLEESGGRPAF